MRNVFIAFGGRTRIPIWARNFLEIVNVMFYAEKERQEETWVLRLVFRKKSLDIGRHRNCQT